MLGCPDCYKEFYSEVQAAVKDVQKSTFHVGKAPKFSGIEKELLDDYKRYQEEKERAVMEGRYADAARITSIINPLQEELKRRGLIK